MFYPFSLLENWTGHYTEVLKNFESIIEKIWTAVDYDTDGVVLEVTQIGKECHTRCAIYHQIGKCVMPDEGVFARVIKGGLVQSGDTISVLRGEGGGQG